MSKITQEYLDELELAFHYAVQEEIVAANRLMESHYHALWQDAVKDVDKTKLDYNNAFIAFKEQNVE
jgi:hypothetical protein